MPVYFIQAGEGGPVKIGFADDVRARLRELQCGNHLPLAVIRTFPGGTRGERWLHRHFAAHRIRGEWFAFHPDMLTVTVPVMEAPALPESALSKYIREANMTREAFAALVGAHPVTVSKWSTGTMLPTRRFMQRIAAATENQVTAADLATSAAARAA